MSMDDRAPAWRRYMRFWGTDIEGDVDAEMEFHVETRMEDLIASGMTPEAARAEVMRRIGDMNALKRECRSIAADREKIERRRGWIQDAVVDARMSIRHFRRTPVLTATAMITLALGLGANTAIFAIVRAVLMKPLSYASADRIAVVTETQKGEDNSVGPGQYMAWRTMTHSFDALSAETGGTFNITQGGAPERVHSAWVTPSVFSAKYMPPEAGRYMSEEEGTPGHSHVVVLSHELFKRRFNGDASIVGKDILLNEEPYRVIGIAPLGYRFDQNDAELWVPLVLTSENATQFSDHWLMVYGRLKPGVTMARANDEMRAVESQIAKQHPDDLVNWSARVEPAARWLAGDYRSQVLVLFGAVGFILLLACLNVSSLLVARATARNKEMAVRRALGAPRTRLIRQLVTESLVLAICGGALAGVVSAGALALLKRIAPIGVPRLEQASLDGVVVLYCAGGAIVCGLLLSLLPAMRASAVNMDRTLRDSGKNSSEGNARDVVRGMLVIGEVALALALLTGAGLFLRSAMKLNRIDAGFNAENLMTLRFSLPGQRYSTPEQVTRAYTDVANRIASIPGVDGVSAAASIPLSGFAVGAEVHVADHAYQPGSEPYARYNVIMPGFFDLLHIPVTRGRTLTAQDRANSAPVVVINESLARLVFPNDNPIGKRIACCAVDSARVWREIVGVTRDVRLNLAQDPDPMMFVPFEQTPPGTWVWFSNSLAIVYRAHAGAQNTMPAVRKTIQEFDANLPLFDIQSFDALRTRSTAGNRFSLILLAALAIIAIVLAAVGIYGVIAFFVQQRSQEIGIRMALGAGRSDVISMVVVQGMKLAGAGVLVGLVITAAASRALQSLLYQVAPLDVPTYVTVAVCLALVALAACAAPARRAAAADPLSSLR